MGDDPFLMCQAGLERAAAAQAAVKTVRLIFLRRYLYVDSVAEIAQRYDISESKVKTQLHRSRQKLRTYLEKEGISV